MLTGQTILIVEDDPLIAHDLAEAVENVGGRVAGPFAYVGQAIHFASFYAITGAILDANLLDGVVSRLARMLIRSEVPLVVHTATGLPADLMRSHPDLKVILKPTWSSLVIEALHGQIQRRPPKALGWGATASPRE